MTTYFNNLLTRAKALFILVTHVFFQWFLVFAAMTSMWLALKFQ